MDHREFEQQFAEETRRLGLNPYRLGGFAASGTGWEGPLLARMRGLEPGATWEDVFPDFQPPEPDADLAAVIAEFDADPTAYWDGHDKRAFEAEFRRVVLKSLDNFRGGRALALRVLRSLPDGAGWEAFQRALREPSSDRGT